MLKIIEKILVQQTRNGDRQAFARLYDAYANKLRRFVYFKVDDENLAGDMAEETFIKILNYLNQGKEIENFQSFLYQTARHLIIDFYRQKGRQETPIDDLVEENLADKKNLARETENKFELEKIQGALARLPEPYREVIVLRFVEDRPFKIIAQIMEVREDYARTLVHRGLKLLRDRLKSNATF